eukprot:TRINITY_DN5482_c0_g1_i2.p1 TRINITY_DN5482_c0_g1~~TRINITY_DN5482_c0_g1_i2.p1  ORF type:complete len:131 (+),score=23.09 TRINITY_DN5482_c0_g1_i2:124-516(+)
MMLGVAPGDIDQTRLNNFRESGWYVWTCGGSLYSKESQTRKLWGRPRDIGTRDKVKISLDLTKHNDGKLSFNLNGSGWREAFLAIPTEKPLHLCVLMAMSGDQIKIEQHIRTANPLLLNKNLYPDFTSTS